jgi:hypothetical protein
MIGTEGGTRVDRKKVGLNVYRTAREVFDFQINPFDFLIKNAERASARLLSRLQMARAVS